MRKRVSLSVVNRHQCWYEDEGGSHFLISIDDDVVRTQNDVSEESESDYVKEDDND